MGSFSADRGLVYHHRMHPHESTPPTPPINFARTGARLINPVCRRSPEHTHTHTAQVVYGGTGADTPCAQERTTRRFDTDSERCSDSVVKRQTLPCDVVSCPAQAQERFRRHAHDTGGTFGNRCRSGRTGTRTGGEGSAEGAEGEGREHSRSRRVGRRSHGYAQGLQV